MCERVLYYNMTRIADVYNLEHVNVMAAER